MESTTIANFLLTRTNKLSSLDLVDKYGRTKESRHQEYLIYRAPKNAHIKQFYGRSKPLGVERGTKEFKRQYHLLNYQNKDYHVRQYYRLKQKELTRLNRNIRRSIDRQNNPDKYRKYKEDWIKNNPDKVRKNKEKQKSIGRVIPLKATGAIIRSSVALDDALPPSMTHIVRPRYLELDGHPTTQKQKRPTMHSKKPEKAQLTIDSKREEMLQKLGFGKEKSVVQDTKLERWD